MRDWHLVSALERINLAASDVESKPHRACLGGFGLMHYAAFISRITHSSAKLCDLQAVIRVEGRFNANL
jgi:hypothetical protein